MKHYRWIFAVVLLLLASLACSAVLGKRSIPVPSTPEETVQFPQANDATEAPEVTEEAPATEAPTADAESSVATDFPLPTDAKNVIDMGAGGVNFQTGMKLDEVVTFYRDAFAKMDLKEREITTVIDATVFSMVFDGDPSGKAVVIQGVDMGDGTININIRYEDV